MPTVLISEATGVRTLTLNRPERRNALTPEMQAELIAALEDAAASASVRVLVITGAGDAFCAGLDLSALQGMSLQAAAERDDDARRVAYLFRCIYDLPFPSIAAVNGPAIAGGAGIATLCDFTLAAETARFGYTEVKIGFIPALVSAYLMLQVGEKRARDLLLTGRLFSAAEALALGLASEVVPGIHLHTRTRALAEVLSANSPHSLRTTKALLREQNRPWLERALEAAVEANARGRETADFNEGLQAFLEKRKPNWSV